MARVARILVPDLPHHVTQRGNRGERVFSSDDNYALYRDLLGECCRKAESLVGATASCPTMCISSSCRPMSTAWLRALKETHRRYTGFVNARACQTGQLFQACFGSAAMDEDHLLAAARYVSLNPVRARLVRSARDWRWGYVGLQ